MEATAPGRTSLRPHRAWTRRSRAVQAVRDPQEHLSRFLVRHQAAAQLRPGMAGQHVLGILPTGTGKSICYQVPALSRYDKTGSITVVISPLIALMRDQVRSLREASRESGGLPYPLLPLLKTALLIMPVTLALQGLSMLLRSVATLRGR